MDKFPGHHEIAAGPVLIKLNAVKVYIINLEESRTRWIQCYRRLSRFFDSGQICRVSAIDGRSYARPGHPKEWAPFHLKRLKQEGLLSGSVMPDPVRTALCLSHQRALRTFLDDAPLGGEDHPWALILEDDARPGEALVSAKDNDLCFAAPSDADLLFLHDRVTGGMTVEMVRDLDNCTVTVDWKEVTGGIGLEAYLVNPRGAKKMLDAWKPLYFECDLQLMTFMRKKVIMTDLAAQVRSLRSASGAAATPIVHAYAPIRPLMQIDETTPSVKMGILQGRPTEPSQSSPTGHLKLDTGVPIAFATCWFNPQHYRARLNNFMHFYRNLKVPNLVIVELAFGDEQWQLPDDLPNLVRLRTTTLCWQKEALLNYAFRILDDAGFPFLGWLDADVVFRKDSWVERVMEALQDKKLVQVFETVELAFPDRGKERLIGAAAGWVSGSDHPCATGMTGFGWVMHSHIWRQASLYDHGILGGGDSVMWRGCFHGRLDPARLFDDRTFSSHLSEIRDDWAKRWMAAVDMKIGYAAGVEIEALPHGRAADRLYTRRSHILREYHYDPKLHLGRDQFGLLQWEDSAPTEMRNAIATYFCGRKEDNLG